MTDYHGWMDNVMQGLRSIDPGLDPTSTGLAAEQLEGFFYNHYAANTPVHLPGAFAYWPMVRMTSLMEMLPTYLPMRAKVEVQADRNSNSAYEIESPKHRKVMLLGEFLYQVETGQNNEYYMTAQNYGINKAAMAGLWRLAGSLPAFLRPCPDEGFVWLGRGTLTPLHHDETNNLLVQIHGTKVIRLFGPTERDRLKPLRGVHSALGWVEWNYIAEQDLVCQEVLLNPGDALFIPIGWWHCCFAAGVSMSLTYTNFIWPNFWGRVS